MIRKFLSYFCILILGFFMVSWQIWARFIRDRLPRDIPDPLLTELRFWILIFICFMYIYVIKNLIKPKEVHVITQYFSDLLYKPLIIMDNFIKYNYFIKNYYDKFITYLINYLSILNLKQWKYLFFCFQIIPRIILINVFILDIFYFKHLEYFYKFVLLGLLPLIYKYLLYSIKNLKENYIENLDKKYDFIMIKNTNMHLWGTEFSGIHHGKRLNIKEYIEFKMQYLKENVNNTVEYDEFIFAREHIYIEYRKQKNYKKEDKWLAEDLAEIKKDFYIYIPKIIKSSAVIEILNNLNNMKYIKYAKIVIYTIYFTCWIYYLYVSYKTYPIVLEYPFNIWKNFILYLLDKNLYDVFTNRSITTKTENLLTREIMESIWLNLVFIFNKIKFKIIKIIAILFVILNLLKIDENLLTPKRNEKKFLDLILKNLSKFEYEISLGFVETENVSGMKQLFRSYFFENYVLNRNFIKNYIKTLNIENVALIVENVDEILEQKIMYDYVKFIKEKEVLYDKWLNDNYSAEMYTKCAFFLMDYSYNLNPLEYDNNFVYKVLNDIIWEDYMKSTDCIQNNFEWVLGVYHKFKGDI